MLIFCFLVCLLVIISAAYLSRFTDRLKQLRAKATKGISFLTLKLETTTISPEISPSTESHMKAKTFPSGAHWPEFNMDATLATLKPLTSDAPGAGQPTIVHAFRTW